jgi:hypothetical protein
MEEKGISIQCRTSHCLGEKGFGCYKCKDCNGFFYDEASYERLKDEIKRLQKINKSLNSAQNQIKKEFKFITFKDKKKKR